MGVLGSQLYVNSNEGHESFARQYQRSEFWYQREAEASNRAQVLWKDTVVVDDAAVLLATLRVLRTLWWQATFVVKDVAMMQRIQAQYQVPAGIVGMLQLQGRFCRLPLTIVSWSRGVGAQWQPFKSCCMVTLTCQMVQYYICWVSQRSRGEYLSTY